MTTALILAGGKGSRFSKNEDKLLAKLNDKTVIENTVDVFSSSRKIDKIIIVASYDNLDEIRKLFSGTGIDFCLGGRSRFESVLQGLKECPQGDSNIVIIHDGARPYVSKKTIENSIKSAEEHGSGVTVLAVTDTLRKVSGEYLTGVIDREKTVALQTPQTFNFQQIYYAYTMCFRDKLSFTDDSQVYSKYVGRCRYLYAFEENRKITVLSDLKKSPRFGVGYDLHPLEEGRKLILCGVEIPHNKGLVGHSDADSALHAVMDAVLSSLGKADIGHYFPPSDAKYKDISSLILLDEVVKIAESENAEFTNLSLTILCENPKLSPYVFQMKSNLSKHLSLPISKIGISVTSLEGVGLVGREEAIAAHAVIGLKN